MKTNVLSLSALVVGATLIAVPAFAYFGTGNQNQTYDPATQLSQMATQDLSSAEETGLIQMREEEKLARDVYLELFDKWDLQTFSNIARSEQRHTDTIKALLDKYSLTDPVKDDSRGIFTDEKLQTLYNDLVAQGSASLVDALKVGATIEDLDIYDLQKFLAETDNEDILWAYKNLERGSRNHLRSFNRQLEQNSANYSAQYLSQSEYDEIAKSDQERGQNSNNSWGQGKRNGQGQGRGRGQGRRFDNQDGFSQNSQDSGQRFSRRGQGMKQGNQQGQRSYQFSNKGRGQGQKMNKGQGNGQGYRFQQTADNQSVAIDEDIADSKDYSDYFNWFRYFRFFRR